MVRFPAEGRSLEGVSGQKAGNRQGGSLRGCRSLPGQEVALLVDQTGRGVAHGHAHVTALVWVVRHSYQMRVVDRGDHREEERTRLASEAGHPRPGKGRIRPWP